MKKYFLLLILIIALFLRIFHIDTNPPSLSWDEASLGYNAYTILTSGRDEFGEYYPIGRFIAFGDYKPPGYIYATVPSVAVLGLNEFSVRFPSLVAGVFMVLGTYLLVKELFKNETIGLLASLFLAISPWALHFSRAAYEANLGAGFNLLGIYLFLVARRKKWVLLFSIFFFILSFYTFNANRIIAPLLVLALSVYYFKDLLQNIKWGIISLVVGLLLLSPSITYLASRESKLRFAEVSIFNNLAPIQTANQRIELDNNSLIAKLIHNRRILQTSDFLKHYFDNFSLRFLFTRGDVNARLAVQSMGQLYVWDLFFIVAALYFFVKRKEKNVFPLLLWMFIVPIPAGVARETPHALRILSILPTYQIMSAYGIYHLASWIKGGAAKRYYHILLPLVCFLLSINMFYYLHDYHIHFPGEWSGEWQYGYKEMVQFVTERENNYDQIFVTNARGRPYIFFAFYNAYPFDSFIKEKEASRDWFGFWEVKKLGKIRFTFDDLSYATGKVLLVTTPGNIPGGYRLIKSISNLEGNTVFLIMEKE